MFEVAPFADLVGKTFEDNGRGPDAFDCYGLLMEMQRRIGVTIPDYRRPGDNEAIAALLGLEVTKWTPCERKPGASVAFRIGRYVAHVGFMLTHDTFIHAWKPSGGVCVERLYEWEKRVAGFYEYRA